MSHGSAQAVQMRRFLQPLARVSEGRGFRAYATRMRALAVPPRRSKLAEIEAAIRRPEGASLEELMTITRWQAHSIRGAISRELRKQKKLPILSEHDGRSRRYRCAANIGVAP